MESGEPDIKPEISANDILDKSSPTITGVGKLKYSRYDDVWPEDVHAAFMEAVALYPPMGKRRLKYYRVSTRENEHSADTNQTKSFGRCQLIQSYILEKTGKNRSRKQVSSHLQRLKKIHKDNPALQPLFLEPPSAVSSQNIPTSIPCPKRNLDLAVDLQNTDTGVVGPSTPHYASEPTFNGGSCQALGLPTNFHDQPSLSSYQGFLPPVPQQCPTGVPYHFDSDYLSESQDALRFRDAANEGFRSSSSLNTHTSAFSTSNRRHISVQRRLVDSGLTMHFSHSVHSPGLQPTYQWISHDSSTDSVPYNPPLTSAQETFHTPLQSLQAIPLERRFCTALASDWMLQRYPEVPLDPREISFNELRLRYPLAMYQYNPTYPEMRFDTPSFHSSPSESEVRHSREFSYSYVLPASPTTTSESVACEGLVDLPRDSSASSENLASPLVIRPTPVYPISYIHPDHHHSQ